MATEKIYDAHRRLVGYIEERSSGEQVVLDQHRRILGYINENGTWDAHRRLVSKQQVPGLMLASQS